MQIIEQHKYSLMGKITNFQHELSIWINNSKDWTGIKCEFEFFLSQLKNQDVVYLTLKCTVYHICDSANILILI